MTCLWRFLVCCFKPYKNSRIQVEEAQATASPARSLSLTFAQVHQKLTKQDLGTPTKGTVPYRSYRNSIEIANKRIIEANA